MLVLLGFIVGIFFLFCVVVNQGILAAAAFIAAVLLGLMTDKD